MWGVILAWLICLASLSLPWPGVVFVVLLCFIALFELANPATWGTIAGYQRATTTTSTSTTAAACGGRDHRTPSSMLAEAFHALVGKMRGGAGGSGEVDKVEHLTTITSPSSSGKEGEDEPSASSALVQSSSISGVGAEIQQQGSPSPPPASTRIRRNLQQKQQQQQEEQQQAARAFLPGSVGSFSRGGLMVTYDGRVNYKVNQDRGLISHPSLNKAGHTIFGVFDGHGENGEHVAAYTMKEVPRRLTLHAKALHDPGRALEDIFENINSSLPRSGINAAFGGCTAVVALVRGPKMWVANAGDSRALVAGRGEDGSIVARGLTRDQNPDSPGERERIESKGGFVSDPEEPGASARVWLDETKTMVGLAMARSIGDLMVKRVGVISLPEVTEYELTAQDEFLILATDGVWEFIDNQEAAEVVQKFLNMGEDAAGACKGLMELANRRWSIKVGDYRDDITATVVLLPFLPPSAVASAIAVEMAQENESEGSINVGAKEMAAAVEIAAAAAGTLGATEAAAVAAEKTAFVDAPASSAMKTGATTAIADSVTHSAPLGSSDDEAAPFSSIAPLGEIISSRSSSTSAAMRVGAKFSGSADAGKDASDVVVQPGIATAISNSSATAIAAGLIPDTDRAFSGIGAGGGESDGEVVQKNTMAGAAALATASNPQGNSAPVDGFSGGGETGAGDESDNNSNNARVSTLAVTPDGTREEKRQKKEGGERDADNDNGEDVDVGREGLRPSGESCDDDVTIRLLSAISGAFIGGKQTGGKAAAASTPLPAPQLASETVAMDTAADVTAPIEAPVDHSVVIGMNVDGEENNEGGGKREQEEGEEGEDWNLDFGARENRQPSREIMQASQEFPSGGLEALVAGLDSCDS